MDGCTKKSPYICFEKKCLHFPKIAAKKKLLKKLNKKNAAIFRKLRQKKLYEKLNKKNAATFGKWRYIGILKLVWEPHSLLLTTRNSDSARAPLHDIGGSLPTHRVVSYFVMRSNPPHGTTAIVKLVRTLCL